MVMSLHKITSDIGRLKFNATGRQRHHSLAITRLDRVGPLEPDQLAAATCPVWYACVRPSHSADHTSRSGENWARIVNLRQDEIPELKWNDLKGHEAEVREASVNWQTGERFARRREQR